MVTPDHDVSQPRDEILLEDEFPNVGVECRNFFENMPCNPSARGWEERNYNFGSIQNYGLKF